MKYLTFKDVLIAAVSVFVGLAAYLVNPGSITELTHIKYTRTDAEPAFSEAPSITASEEEQPIPDPKIYKKVMTTKFWVGEGAEEENGFIANADSYWDTEWVEHYGGVDTPRCRDGYYPCDFVPDENPFYVALPYGERQEYSRGLKASARDIPWFSALGNEPLLKNRWVEVVYRSRTCYAQWEDVGPFSTDDFTYVFGDASPTNTFGVKAGLDVSPAVWSCLGLTTNSVTSWRFVDGSEVPPGPWKDIVTDSPVTLE